MTTYEILMRTTLSEEEELAAAKKYFRVSSCRNKVSSDLVIGRYSVLPYYRELEEDLRYKGGFLVNSYNQHKYIADLKNWYQDLGHMTFETWFTLEEYLDDDWEGPVVLKGETNSLKNSWFTHMFAKNKTEAKQVHSRLMKDSLIGQQQIYIRKYVELNKLGTKVDGRPITEEYRFFFYKDNLLAGGFYWSEDYDYLGEEGILASPQPPKNAIRIATKAADLVKEHADFFVIDVARLETGDTWKVVEVNDGQMSGLSMCDPNELYATLKKVLEG